MRRESARAAFLGIHNNFIEEELSRIEKIVPDKAEKLRQKKIVVFPTFEKDTFQIYSQKGESYNKYYVSELDDGNYECNCMDYLYNGQEEDNYSCKHIWLVRIFVKDGLLNEKCSKEYLKHLYREFLEEEEAEKQINRISDMDELEIDIKEECQKLARVL